MLALSLDSYIYSWQLLLIPIFLAGWVFVGSRLLRRSMRKQPSIKRLQMGKCISGAIFSVLAGMITLGVILMLFRVVGEALEHPLKGLIIGAAPGIVLGVLLAVIVIYVMFGLSFKDSIKTTMPMLGGVALVAIVLGAIAGPITYYMGTNKSNAADCRKNLYVIFRSLPGEGSITEMPQSLQILADKNLVKNGVLCCPGRSDKSNRSYFYLPRKLAKDRDKELLICDFKGNHPDGRNVVTTNPQFTSMWLSEKDFGDILKLPINAEFAKALADAEAGAQAK